MSRNWNKGLNKYTHPPVLKISETMKRKKIDNFRKWREEMRALGKINSDYPAYEKNENLAELIGVILGDGHIQIFPRTERLLIVGNGSNRGFIKRYSNLVRLVTQKEPAVGRAGNSQGVRISIYEKFLRRRFDIPAGNRGSLKLAIPGWIKKNKQMLRAYLRGLYEAEGSYCVHKATSTYKMLFSNQNESLLNNVYSAVKSFGFHPHRTIFQIQISKKQEVRDFKKFINFRNYH